MDTVKDYISQLLSSDIYDTEKLLELRSKFLNPDIEPASEEIDKSEVESEVDALSETFWKMPREEFSLASKELLPKVEKFGELKKHVLKLCKLNTLRADINKMQSNPKLSRVLFKDLRKILVLRGQAMRALEQKVFENIKKSRQQKKAVSTVKAIQKQLNEVFLMQEDWFNRILTIKTEMKHEKLLDKSGTDWFWIALGIFFLIRIIASLAK